MSAVGPKGLIRLLAEVSLNQGVSLPSQALIRPKPLALLGLLNYTAGDSDPEPSLVDTKPPHHDKVLGWNYLIIVQRDPGGHFSSHSQA